MADNVSTIASYEMPEGPSSADYIVQGINSYFARQREDQLKAQEESSKLAGLFANNKMLRKAKKGESADFNIGKVPWVVDRTLSEDPVYGYADVGGIRVPLKSYDDLKKYIDSQQSGGKELWKEKMAVLKSKLSLSNLSADEQAAIQDVFSRKWNGETVDATKYSKAVQDFVKSNELPTAPVSADKKNIFSEKTNQSISESTAKLKERFKSGKARASGELVREALNMGAAGLKGSLNTALWGVRHLTAPGMAYDAFQPNSAVRQFLGGVMTPAAPQPQAPWALPQQDPYGQQ